MQDNGLAGNGYIRYYLGDEDSSRVRDIFDSNGRLVTFRRGELFAGGRGCKTPSGMVGMVVEGAFNHLFHTHEGESMIFGYSFKDDILADFPALQVKPSSAVAIEAIRDSTVCVLERREVDSLLGIDLRGKLAEAALADLYSRLLSMYCDSPTERYEKLLLRHPMILEEVPLKQIASAINVAPETLSRIRKKIVRS